jgi:DNA-binding NtrC family response regulator
MALPHSLLLAHNEPEAFQGLEETLREQGIRIWRVHDCAEARRILERGEPVDLVLTDAALPDGTWRDAIRLVHEAAGAAPVIVMSRFVNLQLYLDTQDGGAADFIVPPISGRDLAYILAVAMSRTVRVAPRLSAPRHRESDQGVAGRASDPVRAEATIT